MNPSEAIQPAAQQRVRLHRAVLAVLLALALVCAQSLGLWHRLVHFEQSHPVKLGTAHASVHHSTNVAGASGSPFSDHQSDTDCNLFDQLSHTDGVATVSVAALGLAVLTHTLRARHGLAVARWHALFQARGPPHLR